MGDRHRDGDENWRIYRVDLENPDAEAVELTPFPGVRAMGLEMPVTWPGKAILRLNGRDPAEFDLYTLDIATGELTMPARNPGLVADLICTPDGDVCALALTADGDIELSQWDVGTGALRPVRTFDGADHPMGVRPFQLTPDGTGAWIGSSRGSDRTRQRKGVSEPPHRSEKARGDRRGRCERSGHGRSARHRRAGSSSKREQLRYVPVQRQVPDLHRRAEDPWRTAELLRGNYLCDNGKGKVWIHHFNNGDRHFSPGKCKITFITIY